MGPGPHLVSHPMEENIQNFESQLTVVPALISSTSTLVLYLIYLSMAKSNNAHVKKGGNAIV